MNIRKVAEIDVENFYNMMCRLDGETEFMMYEPGERAATTKDLRRLKAAVDEAVNGSDLLLVAEDEGGNLAGYIWAERGRLSRVRHTAYIVVGILEKCRGRGVGTEFFARVKEWAAANGVVRLELTVECENAAAVHLYEKSGFKIEGTREKSMRVNGRLRDEYYMGLIIE